MDEQPPIIRSFEPDEDWFYDYGQDEYLEGPELAYWPFSVDDDLRVVFRWDHEEAFLVHLGSHDKVY